MFILQDILEMDFGRKTSTYMALLFVRDSLSNKFDLFLWWWCLGSLDIYYTVISNIVSAVTNTKDRPLFEQKKT